MLDNIKDKTFLIKCTVKYCLFRRSSYALRLIHNLLIRHWDEIPKNDRKSILEDIKMHKVNWGCWVSDEKLWQRILDLGIKDGLILREKENE